MDIKPNMIIVFGLDCATFKLIISFIAQGKLPTFERLIKEGVARILKSTIPPILATVWSTFLPGNNPGNHGIFELRKFDARTYTGLSDKIVNSTSITGKTFIFCT